MSRSKWDLTDGTEDLTGDGSLLKTILVEGDGDTAGRGAKVSLKYSLRLSDERDAEVFDSSLRRKDGELVFTLGRRKVIPALELVAQSMKLGEKCRVKAAAPYAFGSKGLKRKGVPPNTTVYMDVELLHFEHGEKKKPFVDMTPSERFEVAKKCKEEGNALFKELKYDRAMAQYSQCIQYLAKVFYRENSQYGQQQRSDQLQENGHAQGTESPSAANEESPASNPEQPSEPKEEGFEEAQIDDSDGQNPNGIFPTTATESREPINSTHPNSQPVKEGEQVETLDVSTATQEGENPTASVPATNENGTRDTSEEQYLEANGADSKVANLTEQQSEQETQPTSEAEGASEVTKPAEEQSSSSNVADGNEASSSAQNENENGVKEEGSESPTRAEVSALHVTTLNNLSLCLLKLEQFKKAVESSSLALGADPSSFKAFYYRGRALVALGEWDKAREDLMAAYNLQRNNMGIRMEIQKLDRKRKQFEEKEKKQAAAMFA
ncbi:Peptidylprolyl isomerase [Gracilaria domingensis]|nr:Peptidylprolyl isomerase [Gracilaria domingensis]